MPGVDCPECGLIWATSHERIRGDLPPGHPLHRQTPWPVAPARIQELADDIRRTLGLPSDLPLLPGTWIGRVRLDCKRADFRSFEWPVLNTVVMTGEARGTLMRNGLTGWHAEDVVVTRRPRRGALPPLYELVVDGRAGPAVVDPPVQVGARCDVCGYVEHIKPVPRSFALDEARWDGSDFFRFDPPYDGYVFVSQRVRDALSASALDGYELLTLEQLLFLLAHPGAPLSLMGQL